MRCHLARRLLPPLPLVFFLETIFLNGIFMTYYIGKQSGFTLVEVIVVAAMIVFLTTVIVVQVRTLSPNQALTVARADARSLLVQARSYALGGQQCCDGILPVGYGVEVTLDGSPDNELALYADLDGSYSWTEGDAIITTATLPSTVDITRCADETPLEITTGNCDLFFPVNDDTTVYFGGEFPLVGSYTLDLTETDTATTEQLKVHGYGIIE